MYGAFSKVYHKQGHRPKLSRFQNTEIVQSMLSNITIKFEVNTKISRKAFNICKLSHTLPYYLYVGKEISRKIKNCFKLNGNEL